MRTLYLIFSHDHQEQLARLVRAIRNLSPNSLIAIHHDPVISVLNTDLLSGVDGVHIVPDPVHGEWGDFSQIEQFIHAMKWCANNLDWDWLCTLSGLSYPLHPLNIFEARLEASECDAFIHFFDAFDPNQWPKGTAETRYLFTYYKLPRFAYYHKIPAWIRASLTTARVHFNRLQPLFRIIPMPRGARTRFGIRRFYSTLKHGFLLCGGRNILNLNRFAVSQALKFDDENPQFKSFLKRTLLPDEAFFTSIIANDANLRVQNNVLRYIKWPKLHAASAAVITHDELPDVVKSEAPFGLKFDSRVDPLSLDRLDALLGLPERAPITRDKVFQ